MNIAELFIYDVIGYDYWTGGGITAQRFISELNALEKDDEVDEILIRINSPGGSISDGNAIYNAIGRCKKTVNTINDGIAWSMGAIILLSGKKISMANNSTILLHNGWGWAQGNAKDMDSYSEMLKAMDTGLANTIADQTGLSVDEVKAKYFDYADHTLTAKDALENKLIHEITSSKTDVPKDIASWGKDKIFNYFFEKANAGKKDGLFDRLKDLFNKSNGNNKNRAAKNEAEKNNNQNKNDMNIQDFEAIKGKKAEEITAETLAAINAKLKAEGIEGIEINLTGTVAGLQNQIDESKKSEGKPKEEETNKEEETVDVKDLQNKFNALKVAFDKLNSAAEETIPTGEDTQHTPKEKAFTPRVTA